MAGFGLDSTYGAYTIGTFISNILLGITCVQTYTYFRSYNDGLLVKATVICLLVLELFHGALNMHVVYHTLVSDYFDPSNLAKGVWSLHIAYGITGCILLVVHVSYATRIYCINGHSLLVPTFIVIVSLVTFACTWIVVGVILHSSSPEDIAFGDKIADTVLMSMAVLDILTATALSYYLNKSRTGIKQTDKLIDRLMVYSINNGFLTSMADIVAVIMIFVRSPDDLVAPTLVLVIGSLYTISWMATLNSRRRSIRDTDTLDINGTQVPSHLHWDAASNGGIGVHTDRRESLGIPGQQVELEKATDTITISESSISITSGSEERARSKSPV